MMAAEVVSPAVSQAIKSYDAEVSFCQERAMHAADEVLRTIYETRAAAFSQSAAMLRALVGWDSTSEGV
jgi:hypothetical protein